MITDRFEYFVPKTVPEAVSLLQRYGGEAKLLAGGHSLIPLMKLLLAAPQTLTIEDQLRGVQRPLTQVGRALAELAIRWIPADSPQAKGRIEGLWGTFQDRLFSELRRARAASIEEANAVLTTFLPRYNRRFARDPAHPDSAYRPLPAAPPIDDVCCFKYARTVANDNTVRLGEHLIQILPGPRHRSYAKARVVVHKRLDDTLAVVYQDQPLAIHLLPVPSPRAHSPQLNGQHVTTHRRPLRGPAEQPRKPRPDHPWNQYALMEKKRKILKEAGVSFSLNR